jgi:pimeloyl-ACP methyl ester carboxylesterase
MPLTAGSRLGPYEILAPLGAGGMGEVYRARDTRLGREVAVKILSTQLCENPQARSRFEREARVVSGLNHPHICVLHDLGREGNVDYLVMELVDGETLSERIARGPLPIADVQRIGAEIADALHRAHQAGVVHRDLKPSNVMLTRSGAKLMDFGLARESTRGAVLSTAGSGPGLPTQSPTVATPLTTEGAVMGTSQYMAPEQLEGREADARTDLWALGCVLYEMVTGRRVYEGATTASLISAIMKDEPRPLTELAPLTPPVIDRVIRECLAKDPDQRWQNAHDVGLALRLPSAERTEGSNSGRATGPLVEREFVLTAGYVRQLAERNPRLVGYPVTYVDNQVRSDQLVVFLHGLGADGGQFEQFLNASPHRAIAVTLVGFGKHERRRPTLSIDDHSRVLRMLLREIVTECRPRKTLLVGHSAGADQLMRMMHDEAAAGVPVDGLIALGPNVSLDTCFATRLYARIDPANPDGTLPILKSLADHIGTLETWLVVQSYFAQMFMKLGTELEPLRRYAADLVMPFESPGDPLADWYRSAKQRVPHVRLVFSNEESAAAEALLARHLESNVLGDDFTESSFAIERVHHLALLELGLVTRHVEGIFGSIRV